MAGDGTEDEKSGEARQHANREPIGPVRRRIALNVDDEEDRGQGEQRDRSPALCRHRGHSVIFASYSKEV